ncbi:MAG: peptidase MA family metallohydrolase, partial [Anaerolineales bacterium]|nr:peptidase MA family metallohydrolase [Anaerolineales bacterium]
PIQVVAVTTENDYPDGLTFHIHAEADSPITNITLYYKERGDISTARQPIEFESGTEVTASYTWNTSQFTIAPSSPVYFYWTVKDELGNQLSTPEELVYYDDLRFPWKEISDPELIVRWYEGSGAFGQFIYDVARESLTRMEEQTGVQLTFPIFVLVYANPDDFASWHLYVDDWVGGQAFTPLGITTEIIPPDIFSEWIREVIPHEIAHLFFYQVMDSSWASLPTWLNEGLAQYYEATDPTPALERAEAAAREGTLLPLISLSGGFGRDTEQVWLSYDESLSVVVFILETWGDAGLQSLIDVFRTGENPRPAIESALGLTWEEFEADWITWMGVPATPKPSPVPTATLVYPTEHSGWPTPTKLIKPTATDTPGSTAPDPNSTPEPSDVKEGLFDRFCGGSTLGALLLPTLVWIARRRED